MLRKLIPGMAALLIGAQFASADVLFDNRGTVGLTQGTVDGDIFTNFDGGVGAPSLFPGVLEDGTFAGGAGPYNITGINLGYYNNSTSVLGFDALVTFYDTVNYSVSDPTSVPSGQVGSTYRLHITAPAGNNAGGFLTFGESGLISLPGGPLVFPDNTFGVSVKFVDTGTNTASTVASYLFRNIPLTTGTSNPFFVPDFDGDGIFIGSEVMTWGGEFPDANMYMRIEGSPVPEPASLGLLGLAGAIIARRRR